MGQRWNTQLSQNSAVVPTTTGILRICLKKKRFCRQTTKVVVSKNCSTEKHFVELQEIVLVNIEIILVQNICHCWQEVATAKVFLKKERKHKKN